MTDIATQASPHGTKGRDALEQSERKANEQQPENFHEDALTDKIVEIPPIDQSEAPIKGLDPKK